jgi:hypothetical protein
MDRKTIVTVDCSFAATRAALFESVGLSLRLLGLGTGPATDGATDRGLDLGVYLALRNLEARTGVALLDERGLPLGRDRGVPLEWVLLTDRAGSVRVTVAGVIDTISGLSALKAALCAGASVADLLAVNDGRPVHHRARDLRSNAVDLVLLAGGVDEGLFAGGGGRQVVHMARTIGSAEPRPRYDPRGRITVIFAGSAEAREEVAAGLAPFVEVVFADNVRPDMGQENLAGARRAILDVFRQRVVPHDPRYRGFQGFRGLAELTPTGHAACTAMELLAGLWKQDLLAVDAGEIAMSFYSVINNELNRTVEDVIGLNRGTREPSARLAELCESWLPFECPREEIADVLATQRRRPGALPQTWRELFIQQAWVRERMRLGLDAHRKVAALLRGIHRQRNIDEVLGTYYAVGGQTIVDLLRLNHVLLSGSLAAGATHPGQVAALALDGLQPQGLTQLYLDEHHLLAHLGALAERDGSLAAQALGENWFPRLGLAVAPMPREHGLMLLRHGQHLATVRIERQDGTVIRETVDHGVLKRIALDEDEVAQVTVDPARGFDVGGGLGGTYRASGGGRLGLLLDGRGRPIVLPHNPARRQARVAGWLKALGALPAELASAVEVR